MKPQSMTGFARSNGQMQRFRWEWELRSVNGKGLDFRLKLPPAFGHFETEVRKRLSGHFSRGNIQVALSVVLSESKLELVVNEAALNAVLDLKERLGAVVDSAPLTIDALLGIRGVAEFRESEENATAIADRDALILADLDVALRQLSSMRAEEGKTIITVLNGHLDQIEDIARRIDIDPSRSVPIIAERLSEQLNRLLDAAPLLGNERLYAEAALLATKADLREEIDRLFAHVVAARVLLTGGDPSGRRLDFLAQEFNREANTICSKSNAVTVTALGLELKTAIDQLREQVQNLE